MNSIEDVAIAVAVINIVDSINKKRKRRWWVKSYREQFNHATLLKQLRDNFPEDYKHYLRMTPGTYENLLNLVRSKITKQDTIMRASLSAEKRLTATLKFLSTGLPYQELKYLTGISPSALCEIIPETCQAIYDVLKDEYIKFPKNKEDWLEIAATFENKWNFPNCGGCLDGKHIRIIPPHDSGALYYNYKGFYSVILMALVNANYEYIFVDVGKNGRMSDGGVIGYTTFYQALLTGRLHLPENHDNVKNLNFVFLGDEAFSLTEHFLKPYAQRELDHDKRIFNYRLARARNIVEDTFGITTSRFQILKTAINLKEDHRNKVLLSICVLHNFLRRESPMYLNVTENENNEILTNSRRDCDSLASLQRIVQRNYTYPAKENRDAYKSYFVGEGSIPFQEDMVSAGRA